MKQENPEHVARICELVNNSPYLELLSIKLTDIGIGHATIEAEILEKHLQVYGSVHGGTVASLIDTVTFWAVYFGVEDPGVGLISVDLKVNYLAPVTPGQTVVGHGRQIKIGRTLGYAEATITAEDGKILAHGTSTIMVLSGKGLITEPPLPPKFMN